MRPTGGGPTERLSAEEAALLRSCWRYRTIEEHARRGVLNREPAPAYEVAARGPRWLSGLLSRAARSVEADPAKTERAAAKLRGWAEQGLLHSRTEFLRRAGAQAAGEANPLPICTIGMTTRDRREAVRRAILSYQRNARRYGREVEFVLIDDSNDPDQERRNREALVAAAADSGARARYAGRAERLGYAAALAAEAGVERATVEFALIGDAECAITTGAARNSLLLDSVDGLYLLIDDDTVCRMTPSPARRDGLTLTSRPNPTELWFYRDRDEMDARVRYEEADLLGLHEQLLGRSAAALLAEEDDPDELDLDLMRPALERRLIERGGTVYASMAGFVGDSGIGATAYLEVDPATAARLAPDERSCRAAVENRLLLRSVTRKTIGECHTCVGANLALDARRLQPPFTPIERNSDGLYTAALRACFPDSLVGYFPWAVLHDPLERRRQPLDSYWRAIRRIRFPDYVRNLLPGPPPFTHDEDPRHGLRRVGRYLEEAAALPLDEFVELIRERQWARTAPLLVQDSKRDYAALPPFYVQMRRRRRRTIRESMATLEYVTPRDLDGAGEPRAARDLARRLIGRLGRLFSAWPAMFEAAASLRRRGIRLSREV